MFTSLYRVVKFAFQNFFRNFWLSFVTLTILFLALSSVNALVILDALADTTIGAVKDRIDVSVYFNNNVKEEQIFNVQSHLQTVEGVDSVEYISKDEALSSFKAVHVGDENILSAFDVLDENPLRASLVIRASTNEDYQKILSLLEGDQYANLIKSKNFDDHRTKIEEITKITDRVSGTFLIIAIIFAIISIMIVYNTIRVAIYTHRDEIKVMKLVGATNNFILAPFIIEGLIFALVALLVTIVVLYPILGIFQPYVDRFFAGEVLNLVEYFNTNFMKIFGIQLAVAVLVNSIAAFGATRKYLKH